MRISIRMPYVSAYVSIRQHSVAERHQADEYIRSISIRMPCVSIRQHASADGSKGLVALKDFLYMYFIRT
jgi:hypothetical protein